MKSEEIKDFYRQYGDKIVAKRWHSKYPLRAYVHQKQYESVLSCVKPGMRILDAGCGEAVLSLMIAERGVQVVGVDLSEPNIQVCRLRAMESKLEDRTTFLLADLENLPFPDNHFDLVVSSHVLEHLPDFNRGLREVMRVTRRRAVVAIPTINNLCSWVQVGGGWFYLKGFRSFLALPYGFIRVILAWVNGREGVNETYGGAGVPHVFRFIGDMKRRVRYTGFKLVSYEASSLCFPYFSFLLPIVRYLDKFKHKFFLRNLGYGTTFIIEK